MKKIFLDTNILMSVHQFKLDIFSELDRLITEQYQTYILDTTIDELNTILKEQKGDNKRAAKLALTIIKRKDINTLKTGPKIHVDDFLVELAEDPDNIIATQDTALKRRLKETNSKIITIRQKNHLIFS